MRDQMSRKKGGMNPRIIPHPSHLPESHFFNPHNSFMYGFLNFRFFGFCPVFPVLWTPLDPIGPHSAQACSVATGRSKALGTLAPWGPKERAQRKGPEERIPKEGNPWGPMGSHGDPWEPHEEANVPMDPKPTRK